MVRTIGRYDRSSCRRKPVGRVALVTGANSGMGKEAARELARMGAAVVIGCRSLERGETAADDIN